MVKLFISSLLGFAALQGVTALPKVYPEVIPGPGLPSLASLNLTSAQLYEMGKPQALVERAEELDKRFTGECGPADAAYTDVNDIIACFHYLQNLGTQQCTAPSGNIVMCTAGQAHVYGSSINGGSSSSYCSDVALGVLWVINSCTRPDQSCAGAQAASGNGNLIATAVNINW